MDLNSDFRKQYPHFFNSDGSTKLYHPDGSVVTQAEASLVGGIKPAGLAGPVTNNDLEANFRRQYPHFFNSDGSVKVTAPGALNAVAVNELDYVRNDSPNQPFSPLQLQQQYPQPQYPQQQPQQQQPYAQQQQYPRMQQQQQPFPPQPQYPQQQQQQQYAQQQQYTQQQQQAFAVHQPQYTAPPQPPNPFAGQPLSPLQQAQQASRFSQQPPQQQQQQQRITRMEPNWQSQPQPLAQPQRIMMHASAQQSHINAVPLRRMDTPRPIKPEHHVHFGGTQIVGANDVMQSPTSFITSGPVMTMPSPLNKPMTDFRQHPTSAPLNSPFDISNAFRNQFGA